MFSSSSRPENGDSSLAATDSDDAARLEDTAMDPEDFDFSLDPFAPPAHNDEGKERERSLSPTTIGDQLPLSFEPGRSGDDSLSSPAFEGLLKPQTLSDMACVGDEEQPRTLSNMACLGDEDGDKWAKKGGVAVALSPPPSVGEQVTLVRGLMEDKVLNRLVPGQSRFLVGLSWMRRWHAHVGWNSFDWGLPVQPTATDSPGPITNEDILEDDGVTLKEDQDRFVECVTSTMWDLLSGWYGGNPIERLVITDNGLPTVELYQLNLKLARKGGKTVDVVLSKSCTVGDLRREGIARLQIGTPEECEGLQMFQMSAGTFKLRALEGSLKTLSQFFSLNEALVQFELPGDVDNREGDDSVLSNRWRSNYFSSTRRSATPGAVGLNNLGNTCFMNAAIQCLGHIPQVVSYFGEKGGRQPFLEDLNVDNPLGTKGELAKAFGDLVTGMWEGKERCIYPRDFRDVLCDHAQQFLGYEQHDSQEFLAYLLDGIHEDVNRVREKPFVEKVEAVSGEGDEAAAQRAWKAHLRRNDSFVVDTMHGQYKSVVTCPVEGCGKTSTTFDPAMYLSVPLPVTAEKSVELTLATLDGCRPRRYVVWVSQTAKVKDLKRELSKACGKREDRLAFADVWHFKLNAVFEDDHSVSSIRMDDMFVFELPEWPQPPPPPATVGRAASLGESGGSGGGGGGGGGVGGIFGGENELDFALDGWEQKLTPYLMRTYRQKELRNGSDAEGRSRLLKEAKAYLNRFPRMKELAELTRKQEAQWQDEIGCDLQRRLKEASAESCSFTELLSLEELAGFGEAVQALKELVMHEQRDVKVQIVHHRSTQPDTSSRLKCYSRTTEFCFPVLVSYLPHSTTVGEFRAMLGTVLRRLVRPRSATEKGGGSGLDSDLEGSGVTSVDESDAAQRRSCESGADDARDPDTVVQLLRSGELELLSEEPPKGYEGNILGGGDEVDDDLVSDWIEDSPFGLTRLRLRWSDDAAQEAYDSSDLHEVEDDPSVAVCRDRIPEALSASRCLEHFLEREQLDESEMWYCSSCMEHRRAYKELSLWRLPPVLVMHLKRFSYDTHGGWAASREKIDSFVTFPVRGLDMRHLERVSQARAGDKGLPDPGAVPGEPAPAGAGGEDCSMDDWVVVSPQQQQQQSSLQEAGALSGKGFDDGTALEDRAEEPNRGQETEEAGGGAVYDLWGVVNHYGGLNGGHYTAFALNKDNSRWYDFSDDRVSLVESETELVTAAAYVLFYQRRGAGAEESGDSDGATTSPKSSEDEPSVAGDSDRFDGMGV